MEAKACGQCGELKASTEFHKASDSKDGLQSRCKTCRRKEKPNLEKRARWRAANRDKLNAAHKRWRERNPEKARQVSARSYRRRTPQCIAATKAYRLKHPTKKRASELKLKYGMTLADFDRMMVEQGGGCAICGAVPDPSRPRDRVLYVDHDHETGQVRGLLCNQHNRGIGLFGDDPEMLLAALDYLRQSKLKAVA